MKTVSHILDRAETTYRVVDNTEEWQWPERSLQQWDEGIKDVTLKHGAQSLARSHVQWANDDLNGSLNAVHELTTVIVRLGRVRYRTNPHKARVFDYVKPDAKSRATILGAAERLAELWRKLDVAWVPMENMALPDFDLVLAKATGEKKSIILREVDWVLASAATSEAAAVLDTDCMAWYATATALFPDDTRIGKFIRSQIPTTTVPQPPPDQSVITKLEITEEGTLRVEFDADHGTRFTVLYRGPGEAQSRALVVDVKEKFLEIKNAAAGAHHFRVMASNSRGDGPESEEAIIEVPGAKAV